MSNSLINEKSPYLRQHADNPVNWMPWCDEAFLKAEREDKPIFLSIGYSTCHWCHVMENESFEDKQVAEILNRHFISIKVDREERPDVDSVYMQVCTALTGSGGWPLTILMTPGQEPFFAGTYIPREDFANRLGLKSLLRSVAYKWEHDREMLLKAGQEICELIRREAGSDNTQVSGKFLEQAAAQFRNSYDSEYGGFGTAPKFPSAHNYLFLLRYAKLSENPEIRKMVEHSLQQMYKGGIYDHFGGGFARYSTDREWLAPHFEKTLYDNALLALCYTEAWQDGHFALYRQVAESTLDYCIRELKSPNGGFYSAQDADSDGVEGAYYLFTPAEVKSVLGEDDGRHFCECYDITEEGNFHGKSIPNLLLNNRWNFVPEGYEEFRDTLRDYRAQRSSLAVDTKILTGWNGLMLMALSRAARCFDSAYFRHEALELYAFLSENMKDGEKLKACYYDKAVLPGQLDDYAFYALSLLELYELNYNPQLISEAKALAKHILEHFADNSGFFRTADYAEKLIKRPKEIYDGAIPSGNSACAVLFDRLYRLTAEPKWHEELYKQLRFICTHSRSYSAGCAYGLIALLCEIYPTKELVCAAPADSVPEMLKLLVSKYAPELTVLLKTPSNAEALSIAAPYTAAFEAKEGKAAFYICRDGSCSLPYTSD